MTEPNKPKWIDMLITFRSASRNPNGTIEQFVKRCEDEGLHVYVQANEYAWTTNLDPVYFYGQVQISMPLQPNISDEDKKVATEALSGFVFDTTEEMGYQRQKAYNFWDTSIRLEPTR